MSELGAKATGAVGESGITAAHVAASSGNTEVMKTIVNKNRKYLSQQTTDGTTPVYYAAQEGRLAVLKYLHEKGKCDLSSPSNDGRKPIHAACQCGHTDVVKFIVSQSNNSAIFETVPDGATTLHFAASTGQLKTVQWLIDSDVGGTLVNSKDNGGDTPAHDAADNGHTDVLKLLLESGADLYAINNDGNTPYSLALSNQEHGMADFVMAFASNAPQKQEERPSQMTIFDMQGEVDVVDLPTEKQEVTVEAEVEVEVEKDVGECVREEKPVMMNKKEEKKLKKKEKEKEKKEKKQKDKKGKKDANSSSYLGSPGTALLSIPTNANNKEVTGGEGDDKVLDMTEEELDMFREDHKADDSANNLVPKAPPSSDGSDIVVSYGDTTPPVKSKLSRSRLPPPPETIATSDYSTVAEIERAEQKKEKKKKGRKSSKSIQKQKHKEDSSKNIEGAGAILSGPQMGFKPQFRTNPLQQLSAGAPPTPPPTPATGISSSAASEAGMVSTEDEDDMPYDMYTDDVGDRQARDKGESEERDKGESEEKQDDRAGKREHEQEEMLDQMQENAITDLVSVISYHNRTMKGSHLQ
jgi:ankyrin repeat protein